MPEPAVSIPKSENEMMHGCGQCLSIGTPRACLWVSQFNGKYNEDAGFYNRVKTVEHEYIEASGDKRGLQETCFIAGMMRLYTTLQNMEIASALIHLALAAVGMLGLLMLKGKVGMNIFKKMVAILLIALGFFLLASLMVGESDIGFNNIGLYALRTELCGALLPIMCLVLVVKGKKCGEVKA